MKVLHMYWIPSPAFHYPPAFSTTIRVVVLALAFWLGREVTIHGDIVTRTGLAHTATLDVIVTRIGFVHTAGCWALQGFVGLRGSS